MHPHIVPNDNDKTAHCAACDNDGWVELAEARGMAPCKWCEVGLARAQRHPELLRKFDGTDIIPASSEGPKFIPDTAFLREREAAGIPIDALKMLFPRSIWPSEWPSTPSKAPLAGGLNEPNRPFHAENDPIAADQTPQDAFSDDGTEQPDLDDAQNLDLEEVPW